ncbi:MAG: hypothetical protein KC587_13095, partial [Nitrospira sp.]|nr:hypothetical protein [Nitrospira sp.]
LGEIYCRCLKKRLKCEPEFKAPSFFPQKARDLRQLVTPKSVNQLNANERLKSQRRNSHKNVEEITKSLPVGIYTSSGQWLCYLSARLKSLGLEKPTWGILCDIEKQLQENGSGIEEIIFFDPLCEIFMPKSNLDDLEQEDAIERGYRLKQCRLLSNSIRVLGKQKSELAEKSTINSRFAYPAQCIDVGLKSLKAAKNDLKPIFSTSSKLRLQKLQKLYEANNSWGQSQPIYSRPSIFKNVIHVATEIMTIRKFPKKYTRWVIAEILPVLFPRFLFPGQDYPIPQTPGAVQRLHSRLLS